MAVPTIFSRFLSELDIPHTNVHSDKLFRNMTFKSLYGLSHLLTSYHVPNEAVKFTNKDIIASLPVPFLAQTASGIFVIVTGIDPEKNLLQYDSRGVKLSVSLDDFKKAWNGIALFAYPEKGAVEPDYPSHRLSEIVASLRNYLVIASGFLVFAYFFVIHHLYQDFSIILLVLFNAIGLYFSYLLMQKTLNIHTAASDRVCGVLEQGGCDSIMQLKVSKLFGVFSWSEIGFGYFSVSLITLLLFPSLLPELALCNLCCLPYTFWSIWYQKFRAKHWCTLCVGVQSTLWLLFFSYLGGGWLKKILPWHNNIFILLAAYIFTVVIINIIVEFFKNLPCHEKNIQA